MLQPEVFHELSHCQCVYMNVYAAVTALTVLLKVCLDQFLYPVLRMSFKIMTVSRGVDTSHVDFEHNKGFQICMMKKVNEDRGHFFQFWLAILPTNEMAAAT